MSRHLILSPAELKRNAGGPPGYLWHLMAGIRELEVKETDVDLRVTEIYGQNSDARTKTSLAKGLIETTRALPSIWRFLKTYGPTQVARQRRRYKDFKPEKHYNNHIVARYLMNDDLRSVHCHTTEELLLAHHALIASDRRERVRLILTSHCPEMPAIEKTNILIANGLSHYQAQKIRQKLLALDLDAFRQADIIIFPCKEAMEPYYATCNDFADVMHGKDIRFVLTGIMKPEISVAKPLPEFENKFKMVFAGRHNSVKGYDLLTEAVPQFLDRTDSVMLVAGQAGPLAAPAHTNWKEFGWLSVPGELIRAADVFILANRQTYFDLVAIEVMSMGIPLLASATGGNKKLAELSNGVILFEPTKDGLQNAINSTYLMSKEDLLSFGNSNRDAFVDFLSHLEFAKSYLKVIDF